MCERARKLGWEQVPTPAVASFLLLPASVGPRKAELRSRAQVYLLYTLDSTHRAQEHQTKKQSLVLCHKCGGFVCSHNICVAHTALNIGSPCPSLKLRLEACIACFGFEVGFPMSPRLCTNLHPPCLSLPVTEVRRAPAQKLYGGILTAPDN